jgi:Neuraminidase (sialidase)
LYDPGTNNEAFNNEIVVLPSGVALDIFTLRAPNSNSLQVVSSADHGTTWTTAPVMIAPITSVGTPNPILAPLPMATPIRDGRLLAQIAVDSGTGGSGAVAVVWQQQASAGSTFDGIALSVSKDGGATWSTPVLVNGATNAAAFNPTVRYLPNGVLAITYYDLRDYVGGSGVLSTSTWLSESSDGGTTWHELRLQSPFDLNKAPLANNPLGGFGGTALFLGDNQGLALVGSNALPLYAATTSAGAHVFATTSVNPLTSSSAHTYTAH